MPGISGGRQQSQGGGNVGGVAAAHVDAVGGPYLFVLAGIRRHRQDAIDACGAHDQDGGYLAAAAAAAGGRHCCLLCFCWQRLQLMRASNIIGIRQSSGVKHQQSTSCNLAYSSTYGTYVPRSVRRSPRSFANNGRRSVEVAPRVASMRYVQCCATLIMS